jgi:hypothetical protein
MPEMVENEYSAGVGEDRESSGERGSRTEEPGHARETPKPLGIGLQMKMGKDSQKSQQP